MSLLSNISSINSDSILDYGTNIYLIDATTSNITVTLPDILCSGLRFVLKRIDTSSNIITIQGSSPSQTIDNNVSVTLLPLTIFEIHSYNYDWYIINNSIFTNSLSKAVFTTSFFQNTTSKFITFTGSSSAQLVCDLYYPGSLVQPINRFIAIIASNANNPSGTLTLTNFTGGTVIATISYTSVSNSQTIYSTSTISNLPTIPSILEFKINVNTPSSNGVRVYSIYIQ